MKWGWLNYNKILIFKSTIFFSDTFAGNVRCGAAVIGHAGSGCGVAVCGWGGADVAGKGTASSWEQEILVPLSIYKLICKYI